MISGSLFRLGIAVVGGLSIWWIVGKFLLDPQSTANSFCAPAGLVLLCMIAVSIVK